MLIIFTFVITTIDPMKERILEFLKIENKSSAQLAEEIGVQASGISHILSGRNNPSLDFVLKMLDKYKDLSTEWLMFGKGPMYRENKIPGLFDEIDLDMAKNESVTSGKAGQIMQNEAKITEPLLRDVINSDIGKNSKSTISRIVLFFDDNSFEEYSPKS